MLRLGFHHNPFVLVVSKNRAECSTNELQQILSSRSKQPFEIVCHSKINDLELIDAIKRHATELRKPPQLKTQLIVQPKVSQLIVRPKLPWKAIFLIDAISTNTLKEEIYSNPELSISLKTNLRIF
jgi:hypothetical protein